MNGIEFSDVNERWWLETIGGHHWIARRVPDDKYVVMPNQFGIDEFDLDDALGEQKENMCSADLGKFIKKNHLDLSNDSDELKEVHGNKLNARDAFGSHDDADHVYNTPRAWFMERYFNPTTSIWEGPEAEYTPQSDNIPWCRIPEKEISVGDMKYVLSSHFQGTPYDPYATYGDASQRGAYRSIGINRNDFLALFQIRPTDEKNRTVANASVIEWVALSSNVFNAFVPFYTNVKKTPEYLSNTTGEVTTDNFYWANRIIAALSDAHYGKCLSHIERYQQAVQAQGHEIITKYDKKLATLYKAGKQSAASRTKQMTLCAKANDEIAEMLKKETQAVLNNVLYESSCLMKNAYARSD